MDRCFDNYVMTPMQKVVLDVLRETTLRDLHGVAEARQQLQTAYGWLEGVMSGRTWAAGEHFSLVDRAAAPARSMKRGPIAATFHSGRRIATDGG